MTSPEPSWLFPPTSGGQEYASSAATTLFAAGDMEKAVRELLQNSLDNPAKPGQPVRVSFRILQAGPAHIDTPALSRHLERVDK